jgi:hypothetical protein
MISVADFDDSKFSKAYTMIDVNDGIKYDFLQGEELPKKIATRKVCDVDTISLNGVAKLNKSAGNYTAKMYAEDQKNNLAAFEKDGAMPDLGKSKIVKSMDGNSTLIACTNIDSEPTYVLAKVNSFTAYAMVGMQWNKFVNTAYNRVFGHIL